LSGTAAPHRTVVNSPPLFFLRNLLQAACYHPPPFLSLPPVPLRECLFLPLAPTEPDPLKSFNFFFLVWPPPPIYKPPRLHPFPLCSRLFTLVPDPPFQEMLRGFPFRIPSLLALHSGPSVRRHLSTAVPCFHPLSLARAFLQHWCGGGLLQLWLVSDLTSKSCPCTVLSLRILPLLLFLQNPPNPPHPTPPHAFISFGP